MKNFLKFRLFLGIILTSMFQLSFSMAPKVDPNVKLIRVVPISFNNSNDPATGGWNILLGHDPYYKDKKAYWNDFSLPEGHGAYFVWLLGKPSDLEIAKKALSLKTNKVYNDSTVDWEKAIQVADSKTGNIFYFVPVIKFKSNKELNKDAKNDGKDNFSWVQAGILADPKLKKDDIQLTWYGPNGETEYYNISRGFLEQFGRVWNDSKNSLPTQLNNLLMGQNQAQNQPSQSVVITWLNIPTSPGSQKFYEQNQPYYEFTNFYAPKKQINIGNKDWKTTEHYFQAMKFGDSNNQEFIRNQQYPRDAFNAARDLINKNKNLLVSNWHNSVKYQAMLTALRAKFSQDDYLKKLLLGTNNLILVEDTGLNKNKSQIDTEWGAGSDGLGQNHLGRLLMIVRQELKTDKKLNYDPQSTLTLDALKKVNFDLSKLI